MKKFALALMASAAMVLGLSAVVAAGTYPPPPAQTAQPGESLIFRQSCSPIGEIVRVTIDWGFGSGPFQAIDFCQARASGLTGSLLSAAPATGVATLTIPVPAETAPGVYVGTLSGAAAGTITIVVAGPAAPGTPAAPAAPTTPGGGLPAAGSNGVSTMTIIALGLFAVGGGLFGVSQFRRRSIVAA